jgi:hypothetical protein
MQLRDACLVHSGFSARERLEPAEGGMLALQQGCISATGSLDPTAILRVEPRPGYSHYILERGDVLFRSRGTAVSAWAVDDAITEPAMALLPLYILRPTTDILLPGYLAWLLMRPHAQAHFVRESVGSNLQMIRKPAIESLPIELPPLGVQRSVASAALLATRELNLTIRLATLRRDLLTLRLDERTDSTNHDRNTK